MDTGTRLSIERTYLAHERTQLAWVRTALALIGFGFAIDKFFEYLDAKQGTHAPLLSPGTAGAILIALGVASLVWAALQHRRAMKVLHAQCPGLPRSLAGLTSGVLASLGIAALLGAILRQFNIG